MKIFPLIQFNVLPVGKQNTTNPVSFKQIQLTPQDRKIAQEVVNKGLSLTENRNKLFEIFDKYIQLLAKQKTKFYHSSEDLLQSMYLAFFNSIELIKELRGDNILSKLCEILDDWKPSKEDKCIDLSTISLNTSIGHNDKLTLGDRLTESNMRTSASKKNDEELAPIRKELDSLINSINLSDREISILNMVKEGKSISQIANELELSR